MPIMNVSSSSILSFTSPLASATLTAAAASATSPTVIPTALILLNTPIPTEPTVLKQLWAESTLKVCADGGANRLKESCLSQKNDNDNNNDNDDDYYLPDIIVGDLDSLKDSVREYYAKQTSKSIIIQKNPCQDTNDLDKALQACTTFSGTGTAIDDNNNNNNDNNNSNNTKNNIPKIQRFLIYGAFGGRFDQVMASFQALYKWGCQYNYQIFLYDEETFAFLIPGNFQQCEIHLKLLLLSLLKKDNNKDDEESTTTSTTLMNGNNNNNNDIIWEGPTCGLIPLGGKCDSVTTTGLQWNLNNDPTEFGGLLSTSNRIIAPVVTIQSSHPIVFTAEIINKAK